MKKIFYICTISFGLVFVGLIVSVKDVQNEQYFTHCWKKGAGEGSGGFYHCPDDESPCVWVEDEDPEDDADRECESPVIEE